MDNKKIELSYLFYFSGSGFMTISNVSICNINNAICRLLLNSYRQKDDVEYHVPESFSYTLSPTDPQFFLKIICNLKESPMPYFKSYYLKRNFFVQKVTIYINNKKKVLRIFFIKKDE